MDVTQTIPLPVVSQNRLMVSAPLVCVSAQTPSYVLPIMRQYPHHNRAEEIAMLSIHTRRRFIEIVPLAGVAALAACSPPPPPPASPAPAPAPSTPEAVTPPSPAPAPAGVSASAPMLDEKDPQAMALGYVEDTARADKAKFTTYITGSQCNSCALYQGKAGDTKGGCTLFPGKNVAAQGWCSAWAKKA
jgi:High potential iron-sulfur protein